MPLSPRHGAPRRALATLVTIVTLLVPSACASTPAGEGPAVEAERPATTLVVENQRFLDANIYVVRGGQRVRLGLASGNSRSRFTIPASLIFGVTSLRFVADPVGGPSTPVSNEINVTEGEEVRMVIPPR